MFTNRNMVVLKHSEANTTTAFPRRHVILYNAILKTFPPLLPFFVFFFKSTGLYFIDSTGDNFSTVFMGLKLLMNTVTVINTTENNIIRKSAPAFVAIPIPGLIIC